jgi:curved DNA-binding protein CbpA
VDATAADIKAAHARLIRLAHPDKGGTAGLAAQLNAARDRLLTGK